MTAYVSVCPDRVPTVSRTLCYQHRDRVPWTPPPYGGGHGHGHEGKGPDNHQKRAVVSR